MGEHDPSSDLGIDRPSELSFCDDAPPRFGRRYRGGDGYRTSDRIRYIRTIMDELQRIDSHLLYLGCTAQDLGALTAFLYCMRDREHVLNVMEGDNRWPSDPELLPYRWPLQADIDP